MSSSFLLSNNTLDEQMFARGHCYDSCFKDDLPEITLHSILGFGSRHVTEMKILKLTKGEMSKPCLNCKRNCFKWNRSLSFFFEKWNYTIQWCWSNRAWNLKHSSDALIYNENHVNIRYQAFKVIRPTKIKVILLWYDSLFTYDTKLTQVIQIVKIYNLYFSLSKSIRF